MLFFSERFFNVPEFYETKQPADQSLVCLTLEARGCVRAHVTASRRRCELSPGTRERGRNTMPFSQGSPPRLTPRPQAPPSEWRTPHTRHRISQPTVFLRIEDSSSQKQSTRQQTSLLKSIELYKLGMECGEHWRTT